MKQGTLLMRHAKSEHNFLIHTIQQDPDSREINKGLLVLEDEFRKGRNFPHSIVSRLKTLVDNIRDRYDLKEFWDDSKINLHEDGKSDIKSLAIKLNTILTKPINQTLISPFERVSQSFEILQKHCHWFRDTEVTVEERFREQSWGKFQKWPDFGAYFAMHPEEFKNFISSGYSFQDFWKSSFMFYEFPEGESSLTHVRSRVSEAIDEYKEKNNVDETAIISHSASMLWKALNLEGFVGEAKDIIEKRESYSVSPAGILEYRKDSNGIFTLKRKIEIENNETKIQLF